MTALRNFEPTEEYRRYVVTVMANRWDPDEGKFPVSVSAIGPIAAREAAVEKVKAEYPAAMAVHCEADTSFHEAADGGCGARWDHHDNTDPQATLPFGCLPETVLRWKAGDR